jgi:mannobiose 2-epimerase
MPVRRVRSGALIAALLVALLPALPGRAQIASPDAFADTLRRSLDEDLLAHWYPRALDSVHGGYLSDFAHDWTPAGPQDKFIVTQARHVWTTARLHQVRPRPDSLYLRAARHGVGFLRDAMWDETHGGFHSLVSRSGAVQQGDGPYTATKTAYGQAFAIYGLAQYAAATGDPAARRFAQRAFRWLDAHAHDEVHGGYFRNLQPDGTPYRTGVDAETPPKGQNSTIHLLEAFTTLYQVAPDTPALRDRLLELLTLTRDTMTTERGTLRLFFARDWTPISYRDSAMAVREAHYALDHVSFGHDVETAFLMLEAAEALGRDPAPTLSVGARMVDHALRHGWDRTTGGLYDGGLVVGPDSVRVVRRTKAWWAQAEALHTFALWAERRPDAAPDYAAKARATWRYIDRFLIDPEHGGWYRSGLDTAPDARTAPKGSIWKGTYHTARALLRTAALLEGS